MNKVLIFFSICVLGYSCANNKLPQEIITKGYFILVSKSEAESSRIIGVVKDKKTGKTLSSANLSIEGKSVLGAVTDDKGFYILEVPSGNIQIKVTNVGHSDLITKSIKIKPKEQLEIHFYLGTIEVN